MHNAALAHCRLDGSYELIDIHQDHLSEGVDEMRSKGIVGFNVTIPHKDAIFAMSKSYTKEALQVQASNTVKICDDGSLLAHNTDIEGFREALGELISINQSQTACVIGTGGAAKAALLALANYGFKNIFILSRDSSKAEALTKQMNKEMPYTTSLTAVSDTNLPTTRLGLIVNSSPIGQNGVPIPLWMESFITHIAGDGLFFDMVYSKTKSNTPLVSMALNRGLRAVDGTEMLIRQAHKAFHFWTGQNPPLDVMRHALHDARV